MKIFRLATLVLVVAAGLLEILVLGGCGVREQIQEVIQEPRKECTHNLKLICIALQRYHNSYGSFPPAYISDEDGKPKHSWRAMLLAYFVEVKPGVMPGEPTYTEEELAVFKQYDFDQPWNSPNNLALADKMPDIYRCPSDRDARPGETSYVRVVGAETTTDGPSGKRIRDMRDGVKNVFSVVEMSGSGINWLEPRDLSFHKMSFKINDKTGIRSNHPDGANFGFCDASIRFLPQDIDPEKVKAGCTIAGGEKVDFSDFR